MGEEILIFITKPFRECGVSSKNYFQCQLIKPKCIVKVVPFYAFLSDGSGILFWITHPTIWLGALSKREDKTKFN